jgi:hypothetical protein
MTGSEELHTLHSSLNIEKNQMQKGKMYGSVTNNSEIECCDITVHPIGTTLC